MSPVSFGLNPCGCCFFFTFFFYHFTFSNSQFSVLSSSSLFFFFTCCFRLSFSLTLTLLAIFFFYFCESLCWNTTPIPSPTHITAQKPPVGKRTDESSFALDCCFFFFHIVFCFPFILTYVLYYIGVHFALEVIQAVSCCMFFFSFLNGWVSMTGDKRRNAPSL